MALRNTSFGRGSAMFGDSGLAPSATVAQQQAFGQQSQQQAIRSVGDILNGILAKTQQQQQQPQEPSILDTMGLNKPEEAPTVDTGIAGSQGLSSQEWWQKKNPAPQQAPAPQGGAFAQSQPAPQSSPAPMEQPQQQLQGQRPLGAFGAPSQTAQDPQAAIDSALANPQSAPTTNPIDQKAFGAFSQGLQDQGVSPEMANRATFASSVDPQRDAQALSGLSTGLQNMGVPQNIADMVKNPDGAIAAANDAMKGRIDMAAQQAANPAALETLRREDPDLYDILMKMAMNKS
jgi:hypothetical protein